MRCSLGLLFLSLAVFASSSFAQSPSVFSCWDLTYYMKYASMVETDNRYELVIKGNGIGPLAFSRYDETVTIDSVSISKELLIPFRKSECAIADDGKSGHCEKSGNILWDAFFVSREIDNLGDKVSTITSLPATHVAVDFSPQGIYLSIQSAFESSPQSVQFNFGQCYDPESYSIEFPQALRDYLDKWDLR